MMLHFLPFVSVSIRSPLLPSSSFPHPGRRALSACVPASHGGPGIWPRSDPGTPTRPSSAPAPCNVAVRTSCGRHWSYWEEREARRRSDFLKHKCLKIHHISCVNMHLNMMSGQCLHKVSQSVKLYRLICWNHHFLRIKKMYLFIYLFNNTDC